MGVSSAVRAVLRAGLENAIPREGRAQVLGREKVGSISRQDAETPRGPGKDRDGLGLAFPFAAWRLEARGQTECPPT